MPRYLLPIVVGLSLVVPGCEKQQPPKVTANEVQRRVAEAARTAADYARQEKDEYVARAQRAVDDAKAEIDRLQSGARTAGADTEGKLRRRIEAMEARWQVADRKLSELRSASGEAWKDFRSGVDKAVEDLKQSAAKDAPAASSAPR